jgi:hypothetical protein
MRAFWRPFDEGLAAGCGGFAGVRAWLCANTGGAGHLGRLVLRMNLRV